MYVPLEDILKIVASYVSKPIMKLLDWIDKDNISWNFLSQNPNAIYLLEQNKDKINWHNLSENPNAIHLLEQNKDKINWENLSSNPNAIHLLEQNKDKINWDYLSENPNIFEIDKQQTKIYITQNAKKIEKIMNGKNSSCCLL